MAIELNKKKYLVLCVMLILLNHYINGAESQDSITGEPQTPETGPDSPEIVSKIGSAAAEPPAPETVPAAMTPLASQMAISGNVAAAPMAPETVSAAMSAVVSQMANSGNATGKNGPTPAGPVAPEAASAALTSLVSQIANSGNSTGKNGSTPAGPVAPEVSAVLTSLVSQMANSGNATGKTGPTAAGLPAANSGSVPMTSLASQMTNSEKVMGLLKNETKPTGPYQIIKIPENGTKHGPPQVPCYFIFGDSLVDVGNNNILQTLARADYDPYGVDFSLRDDPTGRFSNGKVAVDVVAELLGFDHYMPPSELTNGTDILQGLNFASAAAGIREETAQHLGDRMTMREQVDSFKAKIGEMAGLLGGPQKATEHLGKCLYSVGFGSNDYLNNYFFPNLYPTSRLLTPEQYADDLIKQYTTHLMNIYTLGARKFVLYGVSQVGCSPNALAQNNTGVPDGTCVKKTNDAIEIFNTKLRTLVDTLNKDHPDAKFTYINSFGFFQDLKDKAATYGFKVTTDGCCGIGKHNGLITCLPGITTCEKRNEYLFWDAYHPTEAVNILGAKRSYIKELPTDVHPHDIRTLISL